MIKLKNSIVKDKKQTKKVRSKVIIALINKEINVEQAMQTLNLLLQDNQDTKIKEWLNNELNGYGNEIDIPDYRKVETTLMGSYISGNALRSLKCTNQPIPINPKYVEDYKTVIITCGLNEIVQLSTAEQESQSHSLTIPVDPVVANKISNINGQIISANRMLSIYGYTNILNKIKTKLLEIFIELEKKYGNLNDYYIDFSDTVKEKEINNTIVNIINGDYISIGSGNKIKNSTIGVGHED